MSKNSTKAQDRQSTMKTSESLIDLSQLHDSEANGSSTTAIRILDTRCLCGEGILYEDVTSTVLFVDIEGKTFHSLQLNDDANETQALHTVYALPKRMGSFGMLQAPNDTSPSLTLLCAWEDGFQIYNVATDTELTTMSQGPDVNPAKKASRLNDGRVITNTLRIQSF